MSSLRWSPQALADVQRLYRFLAGKNLPAAKSAAQAIRQGVKVLSGQPRLGRPIPDMDAAYREWLIDFGDSGYVARYRIAAECVVILAVRHQREAGF
jgi:plasmid stabilization system protein ParE